MNKFRVAVTGDAGVDIFSRYISGTASKYDSDFYPEVAYDLDVPCGAGLHYRALKFLLGDAFAVEDCLPKKSTLRKSLQFLEAIPWNEGTAIRISKAVPRRRPEPTLSERLHLDPPSVQPDCLVIHDATVNWRRSEEAAKLLRNFFAHHAAGPSGLAKAIVILGERVPLFTIHGGAPQVRVPLPSGGWESSPVWEVLYEHRHDVAVLCSSTSLRHAGAAISRGLSWEQTIEDTLAECRSFLPLRVLSQFRHLLVRFGFVGAMHVETMPGEKRAAQIIFAPNARDGLFRDRVDDGRVVGRKSVLAAALVRALSDHTRSLPPASGGPWGALPIAAALKTGLTIGMQLFDCGFPCPSLEWYRTTGRDLGSKFLYQFFSCQRAKLQAAPPTNVFAKLAQGPAAATLAAGYDRHLQEGLIRRDRIFGDASIPEEILRGERVPTRSSPWQILRDAVTHADQHSANRPPAPLVCSRKDHSEALRIQLGVAICKFGHREVLNRQLDIPAQTHPGYKIPLDEILDCLRRADAPHSPATSPRSLYLPVLEFGNLVAVEREEIESLHSIRNLLKSYVQTRSGSRMAKRPISIAVFGAPGSGKGFAVKQIAQSIRGQVGNSGVQLETIECNVAQFRTVADLGQVITRIASLNNERKIPLVFFDEFDCSFHNDRYGWLKYFLGPMQDGTFYGARQTITFGRAIFVFAGGVSRTIYEFDPFAEPPQQPTPDSQASSRTRILTGMLDDSDLTSRREEFRNRKGPDFVSRLRGHINIYSINPDDTAPRDPQGKPLKPVIRRAITLRGQILEGDWVVNRDGCKVASIDADVLRALLAVKEYRHGVRSMEAILQMCTPIDGIIEKASLPSRAQLNMHVDADDFVRLLQPRNLDSTPSTFDAKAPLSPVPTEVAADGQEKLNAVINLAPPLPLDAPMESAAAKKNLDDDATDG